MVRLDRSVCSLDAAKLWENNVLQFVVIPHGRMLPSSSTLLTSAIIGAASDRIAEGADGVDLSRGVWTGTPELGLLILYNQANWRLKISSPQTLMVMVSKTTSL